MMNSRKLVWGIRVMYGKRVFRRLRFTGVNGPEAVWREKVSTLECRSFRSLSARPRVSMISITTGCSVSPRNSRSKSGCASRSVTSTPLRASRSASTAPAGPPPTTQHVVRRTPASSFVFTPVACVRLMALSSP
nr:hypothetical protein [Rubrobacter marinus]